MKVDSDGGAARRISIVAVGVLAGATASSPVRAADVSWSMAGAVQALYSSNVYLEDEEAAIKEESSTGGTASLGIGMTALRPRDDLAFAYQASYRYYPDQTNANNLEQLLLMNWNIIASQRTTMSFYESASYSPESANLAARDVDQGFIVAPRARQFRSRTALGQETFLSPRWSFRADYAFRFLNNGRIQRAEEPEPRGIVTIPGPIVGPLAPGSSVGPGVAGSSEPLLEIELLDERGHTASAGMSCQLTAGSDLTGSVTYMRSQASRGWSGPEVRTTRSAGVNLVYGWSRSWSRAAPPASSEPSPARPGAQPGTPGAQPATPGAAPPADEQPIVPDRSSQAPVGPLAAGAEGRAAGGSVAARQAAQRVGGSAARRAVGAPADSMSVWLGVGAYRVEDTFDRETIEELGDATLSQIELDVLEEEEEPNSTFTAELGLIRTYGRGSVSTGLSRGVSTFEGLARRTGTCSNDQAKICQRDADCVEPGFCAGRNTTVTPPGSAIRTTLYASYVYSLTQRSNLAAALNATRREQLQGGDHITTLGAGGFYDIRFASWCGLRASYHYTHQSAAKETDLPGRSFREHFASLGLFFATR